MHWKTVIPEGKQRNIGPCYCMLRGLQAARVCKYFLHYMESPLWAHLLWHLFASSPITPSPLLSLTQACTGSTTLGFVTCSLCLGRSCLKHLPGSTSHRPQVFAQIAPFSVRPWLANQFKARHALSSCPALFSSMAAVSASLGCHNKSDIDRVAYKQQNFVSCSSGVCKSKLRAPALLVSGENMPGPSPGRRGKGDLWDLFYKGANPIPGAHHTQDLVASQRLHLQTPSHWGLGLNLQFSVGNTNIQSLAALITYSLLLPFLSCLPSRARAAWRQEIWSVLLTLASQEFETVPGT